MVFVGGCFGKDPDGVGTSGKDLHRDGRGQGLGSPWGASSRYKIFWAEAVIRVTGDAAELKSGSRGSANAHISESRYGAPDFVAQFRCGSPALNLDVGHPSERLAPRD